MLCTSRGILKWLEHIVEQISLSIDRMKLSTRTLWLESYRSMTVILMVMPDDTVPDFLAEMVHATGILTETAVQTAARLMVKKLSPSTSRPSSRTPPSNCYPMQSYLTRTLTPSTWTCSRP